MIYLDNAATTYPKPAAVRRAMSTALTRYGANPGRSGFEMSLRTSEAVYACRKTAAQLFHAKGAECVIFTQNCTYALNQVIKGFLKSGDHVVVSDMEHNAVMRPLTAMTAGGVNYSAAAVFPADSVKTMESFRKAMRENTKLVVCTQASNVFGIRVPVERIAALAHQYGAKMCVDCAQSAGLVPIDVEGSGIDYLCCAGHKGLYGPMGTGMLILRNPEDGLKTLVEGGTGTQSKSLVQPRETPEGYESGTVNVPGIIALRAGMEFVMSRGEERLWKEESEKTLLLYRRLKRIPGVRLYTDEPAPPWYLPVLSFNIGDIPSESVGQRLAQTGFALRCGLHCAPTAHEKLGTIEQGTVRVCPGAFTRTDDVIKLSAAVAGLASVKK